jgi:hypothetical protein
MGPSQTYQESTYAPVFETILNLIFSTSNSIATDAIYGLQKAPVAEYFFLL